MTAHDHEWPVADLPAHGRTELLRVDVQGGVGEEEAAVEVDPGADPVVSGHGPGCRGASQRVTEHAGCRQVESLRQPGRQRSLPGVGVDAGLQRRQFAQDEPGISDAGRVRVGARPAGTATRPSGNSTYAASYVS